METGGDADETPHEKESRASEAVAMAAAAFVGARLFNDVAVGSAAGAGLGPYLREFVDRVRDEWRVDQRQNIEVMAETAATVGGWSPNEFGEQMGRSPRTRLLTATAAEAAAKTAWPPKVVALGRVLAAGLIADDDAVVDRDQLALLAMAEIERPQLLVLDELASSGWVISTHDLVHKHRQLAGVLSTVLGPLQRHGLVEWSWGHYPGAEHEQAGLHLRHLGDQIVDYFLEAGGEALESDQAPA
jgi:hypothetical protein